MTMAAAAGWNGEARDDDVGTEFTDDTHDITEHFIVAPDAQRFLRRLGIAKINGAGEELAAAVELAGGEQFVGADEAELFIELRPQLVLPAVAAIDRKVSRAIAACP